MPTSFGSGIPSTLCALEASTTVVQSAGQLVLQPQSETEHLRRYIAENGWKITEEKMLIDAGKYYVVLNVDVTAQDFGNKSAMDEVYYKYGYYLIHNHDKILGEYLRDKLDSTGKVLDLSLIHIPSPRDA